MTKFKYKCIQFETKGVLGGHLDPDTFQHELNKYGAQGWEIVSIIDRETSTGRAHATLVTFKKRIE